MSKKQRFNTKSTIKKPTTLVSIIIPVMGRFDLLTRCLEAIPKAADTISYEVIIVDNNSPKEEAEKFYGNMQALPFYEDMREINFKIIRNSINAGFPKACNLGVRETNSPLLFFLNSDVILHENAIKYLVKDMDYPEIGVAGMLLLFPEYADGLDQQIRPPGKVQHVGLDTNIRGRWVHTFVGWDADNSKVLAQRECYAVTGAALMTRKKLYVDLGGFQEIYGLGTFEDCDFCMTVREKGYNIVVNTEAVGTHYTGATAEFYRIGYPMDQNRLIFLQRWASKMKWSEWEHW